MPWKDGCMCLLAAFLAVQLVSAYYLQLSELYTSEGTWDPVFDPGVNDYHVRFDSKALSIVLQCKVDFSKYEDPDDYPVLVINGSVEDYGYDQPVAQSVDLGTSPLGSRRNLTIVLARPGSSTEFSVYTLHFERDPDLEALMRVQQLSVVDGQGNQVALDPPFSNETSLGSSFQAQVEPQAEQVNVSASCPAGVNTLIQGRPVDGEQEVLVPVSRTSTNTMIQVACDFNGHRRTLTIHLEQHIDLDALELSFLVLGGPGSVAWQESGSGSFAYFVRTEASVIELVPEYHDERALLTLTLPDGIVSPLSIGIPTPPLDVPLVGNVSLPLTMRAGTAVRREVVILMPQQVPAPAPPPPFTLAANVGRTMAVGTVTCRVLPALITGASAVAGFVVGAPRTMPASTALRSLALLLQFVAFLAGGLLQGEDSAFTAFGQELRWLSLMQSPASLLNDSEAAAGSPAAVEEARACLVFVRTGFCALLGLHCVVLLQRLLFSCSHTVPHGLCLGAWEGHCMPYIVFPSSCAASVVMLQGERTATATVVLVLPLLVAAGSAWKVRAALRSRSVVWVAQQDVAAAVNAGAGGYFCDRKCDQLTSRPVDRAHPRLPALMWVSTVADIRPLVLERRRPSGEEVGGGQRGRLLGGGDTDDGDSEPEEEAKDANDTDDPEEAAASGARRLHMAAVQEHAWIEVEVVSTLRPSSVCGWGREALVGHCLSVAWLDALLSVEAVLRLHQEVEQTDHEFATPLRARIGQLQGSITSGRLAFCFDGVRWPQLLPAELLLRWCLGVLMALMLSRPGLRLLALACMGVLEAGAFAMSFLWLPCTTFADNTFLMLGHLTVSSTALVYLAHFLGIFTAEIASTLALFMIYGVAGGILWVAFAVTISLVSTVACPPAHVEEEEEDYQSCNVDLALTGPDGNWFLLMPAESRVPVSDAFVHTVLFGDKDPEIYATANQVKSRPRLEFPVLDFLGANHKLEPPLAILLGPPIGRRHGKKAKLLAGERKGTSHRAEWIYPDDDVRGIVTEFVVGCDATCEHAMEITAQVVDLVRRRASSGTIFVVVILPIPKRTPGAMTLLTAAGGGESDSGGEDAEELQALVPSARHAAADDADESP